MPFRHTFRSIPSAKGGAAALEGYPTESRIDALKHKLQQSIDPEVDSVLIYRSNGCYSLTKEKLGHFPADTDSIL